MQIGYFIFSGIFVLIGCLGIMMMFMAEDSKITNGVMLLAVSIGFIITCFNFITLPYQAVQERRIACLLGILAYIGFAFYKRANALVAKFLISLSIILGVIQLILQF